MMIYLCMEIFVLPFLEAVMGMVISGSCHVHILRPGMWVRFARGSLESQESPVNISGYYPSIPSSA